MISAEAKNLPARLMEIRQVFCFPERALFENDSQEDRALYFGGGTFMKRVPIRAKGDWNMMVVEILGS